MECIVCFNVFDDVDHKPLFLSCGHTFCKLCLGDLHRGSQLSCPVCNTLLSVSSVEALPVNYSLLNIPVATAEAPQKDSEAIRCPQHPSKKGKFYCISCRSVICSDCFINHKAHEMHDIDGYLGNSLDTIYQKAKNIEHVLATRQTELASILDKTVENVYKLEEELKSTYEAIRSKLDAEYERARDLLQQTFHKNKADFEGMLAENSSLIEEVAHTSKKAIDLRHSYNKQGEQFEIVEQMKQALGKVEGVRTHIDFDICAFYKARESDVSLGRLERSTFNFDLTPMPGLVIREQRSSPAVQGFENRRPEASRTVPDRQASSDWPNSSQRESLPEKPSSFRSSLAESVADLRQRSSEIFYRGRGRIVKNVRKQAEDFKNSFPEQQAAPGIRPLWSFLTNANNFKTYRPDDAQIIEEAYQQGVSSLSLGKYDIDLQTMVQINKKTKKARKIRRMMV
mmetsp:Transcript_27377/g.49281  ORF Transcript_27377/g.49281 Transcript_27377/m.49281 type:complete len:454 (+) Transcript_27377:468-1829(+)|eukprot:CAMPEP_0204901132 /NCGR_PEP_ID=MMETSP1397-20131031/2895_1 /ASSEMBLY_ACC=CAM_ASM_000891 /TAXON_ID=49980 /ORGANISM="Climacostomum Climacostomum virens, Strain Stock W-24" /LENGTH=453 /DNA_ID=CAMNT_0052069427 /DNA_START=426 /DNA_END=1787 /DNA_ORIENTATION=-